MGLLSTLRDRYIVAPVAKRLLDDLKIDKADKPNIFQVPMGFNSAMVNQNKRMVSGGVDFAVLRALSVNHETTRAAINVRKRQITQLDIEVVNTDPAKNTEDTEEERRSVKDMITNIGGPGVPFRKLLNTLIEDVLVLDACVFYKQKTVGGKLLRVIPVDGATIKLRVADDGSRPLPPEIAYEQWIRGEKVAEMTTDDIIYEMMNPRTSSPYGLSPIESLILTIDTSLKAGLYNSNYLSDNNVPQGFLSLPEGWTVQQIKEYKEWFDAMLTGSKNTSKVFPIPAGAAYQATSKPTDFSFKDFYEYLDRKVCMLFDVSPQELGINLKQYKENAEGQDRIQVRKGIKPLVNFLSEIFTDLIQLDWGYKKYSLKFTGLDGRFSSDEVQKLVPIGVIGIDEARAELSLSRVGVDNIIVSGMGVKTLDEALKPEPAPTAPVVQPTQAPKPEQVEGKKVEKRAKRNVTLERVESKSKFKKFNRAVEEALKKQMRPFTSPSAIARITERQKLDLNEDSFDEEFDSVEIEGFNDYLKWAASEGGNAALQKLNIDKVFKPNPKFQSSLEERETYLIDSVDSTTKDYLIRVISEGKAKALTNEEIARQISDEMDDIAQYRADMIVRTEVTNAMQQAELDVYKDQGIEKKVWVLSEDIGDECGENEDAGPIGVDETFPSGDDAPPAHPNCRCFLQAVIE